MIKKIITTNSNDATLLLVRILLGSVMLAHGLQKTFGWFGGFGWNNTINYFTGTVGLPAILAIIIILIESVGAILLIAGIGARVNAFLMIIVILGAFFVDHLANGFYMNWFGNHKGEGFEFDILFWAIGILIVVKGAGSWSVDGWLDKKMSI
ncbi:MAG: DoxX family protein [Bacteroidetes bacterium]|nr:DoxX family protein [Bacteroidota bacterium]